MGGFSNLSDTDESAVEQILAEAMDECVLQQVASINCASFSNSVLPSNLESRFQRLKTFPSSSYSSSKSVLQPQLAPDSATELKNEKPQLAPDSATKLKSEKPSLVKIPEKEKKFGCGYLSSPSGSSNSSSGYLNSPKMNGKKGKDGSFSSGSVSFRSKSSGSSKKTVKTGCFWCSPKKKSDGGGGDGRSRNRKFEMGDDWGKNDEILSDLRSFSLQKQKKLMKLAKKEEEKINKEAEEIVKWAKQTSARLDFSVIVDDDHLSD